MLCAPVSDSNPALMMASTTSRTHRPFSSRSRGEPELLLQLAVRNDDPALGVEHAKPCGMLLIAVSKRLASSDMLCEDNDGIKQRAAPPIGDEFECQEGGDEQAGENPVKQLP